MRTLWRYAGIGAVVLVAVASIAVFVSVRVGHARALRQPVAGGEIVAARVVAPAVTQGVYDGNSKDLGALDDRIRVRKAGSTIERVKVWSADGVILYCDDPRQIGQRYPLDPGALKALNTQRAESTVTDLSRPENVLDQGFGESLEVSTGTRDAAGRPILVQTYFTVDRLDADEAALIRPIVAVVLVSLLLFGLLLVSLAYSLTRRVSRLSGDGGPGAADDTR